MRRMAVICNLAMSLLFLCLAPQASAGMYKIVGADGAITYSDNPPVESRTAKVSQIKIQSYVGPAQMGTVAAKPDWAAILKRPIAVASKPDSAASRGSLVMFSTPTCGYCKRAKAYMSAKGIAYEEVDVEQPGKGLDEYSRLGGRGVPFFVLGDKTMTGFSEERLNSMLGI